MRCSGPGPTGSDWTRSYPADLRRIIPWTWWSVTCPSSTAVTSISMRRAGKAPLRYHFFLYFVYVFVLS